MLLRVAVDFASFVALRAHLAKLASRFTVLAATYSPLRLVSPVEPATMTSPWMQRFLLAKAGRLFTAGEVAGPS